MPDKVEKRRAKRIALNQPAICQPIGQPVMHLHANLARVYERIHVPEERIGERLPGTIRDLSTNGAFLSGEPLPLGSRVVLAFDLPGYGHIEAIGWTLWRRRADCELPRDIGSVMLPRGFGVLFEAIALDARIAIHKMVTNAGKN